MGEQMKATTKIMSCFRLTFVFLALLGMAITASVAEAQVQGVATIRGTVTDSSGAAMAGATVTATSPALPNPQFDDEDFEEVTLAASSTSHSAPTDCSSRPARFQTEVRSKGIVLGFGIPSLGSTCRSSLGRSPKLSKSAGKLPVVDTATTTPVENFTDQARSMCFQQTRTQLPNIGADTGHHDDPGQP